MDEPTIVIGDTACTLTLTDLKLFLGAALAVKERREGFMDGFGICSNMDHFALEASPPGAVHPDPSDWIPLVVHDWPEWSGHKAEEMSLRREMLRFYPVPHPTHTPKFGYEFEPLWDRRTRYGKARHSLLDWLITKLEQQIEELTPTGIDSEGGSHD